MDAFKVKMNQIESVLDFFLSQHFGERSRPHMRQAKFAKMHCKSQAQIDGYEPTVSGEPKEKKRETNKVGNVFISKQFDSYI